MERGRTREAHMTCHLMCFWKDLRAKAAVLSAKPYTELCALAEAGKACKLSDWPSA